jgi:hypothetical protein
VGALVVDDVTASELMKIRLLNGGHSAICYISYLLGHRDVDKSMADPRIANFLRAYFAEVRGSGLAGKKGRVSANDIKEGRGGVWFGGRCDVCDSRTGSREGDAGLVWCRLLSLRTEHTERRESAIWAKGTP